MKLRALTLSTLILVLLVLTFLYAPVPFLEPPQADPAVRAAQDARGEEHFEKILDGRDLDRPFPTPTTRPDNPMSPEKVELGRLLYYDPLLSGDNDVSCAHCHHPDLGFSDNRGRSMGRGGKGLGPEREGGALLRRGSPTVWNSAFNHLQFWDGRAEDLEEQAGKPIQDPSEMAQDPDELVAELGAVPEYRTLFAQAFGAPGTDPQGAEEVTFDNATYAIAAFERTLVSQDSDYDRYARGDRQALGEAERRGLNVFRSLKTRCFECHNLPTFANPDFKVIGVPDPPEMAEPDLGRGEIVQGEAYDGAFKVPTLRNIALTAPYMHNGAFATLSEVIDFYSAGGGGVHGQEFANLDDKIRPFELTGTEKQDLIAFLHALTDESQLPEVPETVPSGLPVVERLPNQSPEMAAFEAPVEELRAVNVRREGQILHVGPGERIQDAIDAAQPGDTVRVAPGVYHETLTMDLSGIVLEGAVVDGERAVLDGRNVLSDGVIGSGSDLEIRGFAIRDYTANGVMINLGSNITFRDLHLDNTGLYGLYPVEVVGVLVEDSSVTRTRDAGIYVGQSKDILVRRNKAFGNVTGIEIENSLNAVVEDNEVWDNTGGILVFGLPNVPSKVSRGCRVINNKVYDNNHENFADPNAIVAAVPPGTGILVLAGDEVEITGNQITGNDSFGVGVASLELLLGPGDYDIDPYPERVVVSDNHFEENGNQPAAFVTEAGFPGADILWDLSGEGNAFDQPGVSSLPSILPGENWGDFRRRANQRLWRLLMAVAG